MSQQPNNLTSRDKIFAALANASGPMTQDAQAIQNEAQALLAASEFARPQAVSSDATEALIMRVNKGLVIGTTCERINTLSELPASVLSFLNTHKLAPSLNVQKTGVFNQLDWGSIEITVDIKNDNTVGLCLAEYGVAETGSFVVHSGPNLPVLLNFLPLYLMAVIPKSKILPYMDDYAAIANDIASKGETPRNMCLISGVSGTTDIEGVLVQGAHGPEFLHLIIVDDM